MPVDSQTYMLPVSCSSITPARPSPLKSPIWSCGREPVPQLAAAPKLPAPESQTRMLLPATSCTTSVRPSPLKSPSLSCGRTPVPQTE